MGARAINQEGRLAGRGQIQPRGEAGVLLEVGTRLSFPQSLAYASRPSGDRLPLNGDLVVGEYGRIYPEESNKKMFKGILICRFHVIPIKTLANFLFIFILFFFVLVYFK